MTKTKEFILDADTGQYLDDSGNTVAEVVGDGSIEDVTYVGDKELVEFSEGPDEGEDEEQFTEVPGEDYQCDICGREVETKKGIRSHISQVH